MSFLTGVILSMLEKELVAQEPGAEQYFLNELSILGNDLLAFVEKKIGINASAQPQVPVSSSTTIMSSSQ